MLSVVIYGFLDLCGVALCCNLNRQFALRVAEINGGSIKPDVVSIRELVAIDLVKELLKEMFGCNVVVKEMNFTQEFCMRADSRQVLYDAFQ
ncbi:hypothetical protein EGJ15_00860 [Pseudomonas sp. p99-361]|nr:hypothetical protein EGJ15_00860 [Pseudomonas sp. p99-361]